MKMKEFVMVFERVRYGLPINEETRSKILKL